MKNTIILCPVCNKYEFKEKNDYSICKFCGWENEEYFNSGGANDLSLIEYKKRYDIYLTLNPKYLWKKDNFPTLTQKDIYIYYHKFSTNNKNFIDLSTNYGCFFCERIFDKSLIKDYIDDKKDLTALCPFCNIDSLLPDSKITITTKLLKDMKNFWFN